MSTVRPTPVQATAAVTGALPALTPAGRRLLEAANGLFYARGVRAVGVDLIAETAGTTKKTLYDCFGSKDALVAIYLQDRAHRWQEFLLERVDASGGPVERVVSVYQAMAEWMGDNARGCAFINAYAEVGGTDHPAVPVVHAEKAWMRALFDRLAGDRDTGARLHLLYEGAMVLLTAGADPAAADVAAAAAREVLTRPLS